MPVFLKEFLKSFQNSKENTQVFSCEFGEIFKSTFFTENLWTTASVTSSII